MMREAVRSWRRRPGFALVVVLTFALGIGSNTAVFSVVHAVLLKPLPFTDPDRLVVLEEFTPSLETRFVSPVSYHDWLPRNEVFTELAAFRYWETVNFEDGSGDPQPIDLVTATANYFDAIGMRPFIGRGYKEEQSRIGGSEAVLSHEFWTRRYGGDPRVLGRTIRIRGTATTVVGIMPPMDANLSIGFGDVWTCLYRYNVAEMRATKYRARYLTVIGRMKPGVTLAQARGRMEVLQHQLWKEATSVAEGYEVRVRRLEDALTGQIRSALVILVVAVALVLLAACASVANLMLARAADRHGETAVRVALGASLRDLVRLLLAESALLAALGGITGIALAWLALNAVQRLQPDIPRLAEAGLSIPALACAIAATVLAAVLSSLAPIAALRRADVQVVLRQGGRGHSGSAPRVRRLLVACQTALACLLLICGGLLLRSFQNMLQVDPGFVASHAVMFDLFLPNTRYPAEADYARFYRELLRRLEETSGVKSAGALLYFPYKPKLWQASIRIERDPRPEGEEPVVYYNEVAGNYFAAMGIPLKAGRLPTPGEMWESPRVVLVNEAMAQRLFPGRSPVGERMVASAEGPWVEIIGVVGDVRQKRLDEPAQPEYYTTFASMPMPFFSVVARTDDDAAAMTGVIRDAVHALDPGLALANLQPLDDYVARHVRDRRFVVAVIGLFAVLALTLGAVGVYGVLSHSVAQRTREIGVRLALGAAPSDVSRLVVGESARLVAAGTLVGVLTAIPAARLLQGLLFGIDAFDPATYVVVTILLGVVALAAAWWPARQAARIDAVVAMREP